MTRFRYGVAAIAAAAFLVSGCSGAEYSTQEAPQSAAGPVGGTVDTTADGGGRAARLTAKPEPAAPDAAKDLSDSGAADAAEAAGASGGSGDTSAPDQQIKIAQADRSIIYTAEMTVRAKSVATAADRARQLVTGAGGYIAEEKSDSFSLREESVITFKIPPDRYPAVLTQLGRDLGKRESLHQGAQDVTEEVADVASRVKSASAALDQFRTLLTKANKIGEILEIEREISNREAELEALQARQKALAAQTGMATVTLTLVGPTAKLPEKPEEGPSGFLGGLKAGWKALVEAVNVGLTVLGALLPWLIVFAVLWLVAVVIWRRTRRGRTAPEPTPVTAPSTPRTEETVVATAGDAPAGRESEESSV